MILISRGLLIHIARFCNTKKLLGTGRIRVHKNRNKAGILCDMKQFFTIIHLRQSLRLVPLEQFRPILPEIHYFQKKFFLNGKPIQSLFEWTPFFSS